MKRMLMVIMAVASSFSAASLTSEGKKDKRDEKKGSHAQYVARLARQLLHRSPLYTWVKIKKSSNLPPST